ncbi:TIR domain-containing protein [Mastigocladopsis repens]|uniref:TIR domain-containing protein n=1 Tax=Mastigocladopsis repens TaxID=221287 RepID=UPI000366AFAB|nr:TIR domain-containing protein [Mastigocladopsis repens]
MVQVGCHRLEPRSSNLISWLNFVPATYLRPDVESAMGMEGNQWYRPVLYLRWEDNKGGQLLAQVMRAMNEEFVNPLVQKEQNLIWKDSNMTATYEYDVFISHATEDKDFVRPLAEELQKRGYRVWYDEFFVRWGDSISSSIDKAISQSKFAIIVLSRNFFQKTWTKRELEGFVSKEVTYGKVILPIWHKVSKEEVLVFSPTLADKVAVESSRGIDYIISKLVDIMTQNSAIPVTPPVKLPKNTGEMPRKAPSNARSEFYKKRIAAKKEELAAIDSQLAGTLSAVDELKLNKQAEGIMKEIEELEAK